MLYHRCSGAGEPLILIHGLFGSLENLGAVARVLAKQYQVYSIDLPNHGRSSHLPQANLETMAQQVNEWMSEQDIQAAHVVGHSLGGKVAMELALTAPDKVERMVVIDIAPVAYAPKHDRIFEGLLAIDPAAVGERGEADRVLAEYVPEAAVRSFLLKNLVKAGDGFAWRMNLNDLHRLYPQLVKGNRMGAFARDVLFLKGADSDYLSSKHKEDIVERFPAAQLRVVEGTGHWLHAEKPELVGKLILKFLAS